MKLNRISKKNQIETHSPFSFYSPGRLYLSPPANSTVVARLKAATVWGALRGLETLSQLIEWNDGAIGCFCFSPL